MCTATGYKLSITLDIYFFIGKTILHCELSVKNIYLSVWIVVISVCNVGYLGECDSPNRSQEYTLWRGLIERCYNPKRQVLFKFKYADSDKIIPLLKPRTSGSNISPFSSRNLPQNKNYRIPDEDLIKYKNIIEKIPSERILTVSHTTNSFIKSLANKRKPLDSIKTDMKLKRLRGKEYIHSIGLWDKYIKYLEKNL